MQKKKVVTIGGGTGSYTVLMGLKKYNLDLTAIVSMADDGGSTGRLRDELGVLPPGDIRQCLVALSKETKILRELFNYRFESGQLKGHSLGNLFLSASEKKAGNFSEGLKMVEKILNIKGRVLPVTNDDVKLCVQLSNNKILKGQNEINHNFNLQEKGIKKIYLEPKAEPNPEALEKIKKADLIIIGPGNHYCSVIPNLIVKGISEAIFESQAEVVYICNLVNKKGYTENLKLQNYVNSINNFFEKPRINTVIYNEKKPSAELCEKYENQGEALIKMEKSKNKNYIIKKVDVLSEVQAIYSKADSISKMRSLIRHDSDKLASELNKIISK